MPYSDNYYENLSHLLRFFTREGARGYVFGTSKDQRLIRYINEELKERAKEKSVKLKILFPDYESDVPVMEQIRRAAAEADGLLIGNLDELILRSKGDILLHLNFSRESLQALDKPLLFWASQDNLSRIANQAGDLFSQRALPTFAFDEQALAQHQSLAMEARFADDSYRTKEEYKELELKIKLLEKQLEEAEKEGVPPKRIADSLALPLAEAYVDNQMTAAALELVKRYGNLATTEGKNLSIIGDVFRQANEWDKAINTYQKALALVGPREYLTIASLFSRLASACREIGQEAAAVNWNKKATTIVKETLGKNNLDLATSYDNLGLNYRDKGELKKALKYHCKALAIKEKILNPYHLSFAKSYGHLASLYHSQKKLDKALEYCLKAIAIEKKILDSNHPDLAQSYNNIGEVYRDRGELEKALEYHFKANAILKKVLGLYHPNLAASYNNLGLVYDNQEKSEMALKYFLKAIDIFEKTLDPDHLNLATAYGNIARAYNHLGEYTLAKDYMEKAVSIRKKKLPEEHPRRKEAIEDLQKIDAKLREQKTGK